MCNVLNKVLDHVVLLNQISPISEYEDMCTVTENPRIETAFHTQFTQKLNNALTKSIKPFL